MDNEKNWYPKYPSIHVSKENGYPCIQVSMYPNIHDIQVSTYPSIQRKSVSKISKYPDIRKKWYPLIPNYSTYSQKLGEDFTKFCGLLRIYELYCMGTYRKTKNCIYYDFMTFGDSSTKYGIHNLLKQ